MSGKRRNYNSARWQIVRYVVFMFGHYIAAILPSFKRWEKLSPAEKFFFPHVEDVAAKWERPFHRLLRRIYNWMEENHIKPRANIGMILTYKIRLALLRRSCIGCQLLDKEHERARFCHTTVLGRITMYAIMYACAFFNWWVGMRDVREALELEGAALRAAADPDNPTDMDAESILRMAQAAIAAFQTHDEEALHELERQVGAKIVVVQHGSDFNIEGEEVDDEDDD